jgi:hypothetical protein
MNVKKGQSWDRAIFSMDEGLYHLEKKTYWNQPHTCYRWPVKPVSLNGMQNLCEHQLSPVCLLVPFWLAVK